MQRKAHKHDNERAMATLLPSYLPVLLDKFARLLLDGAAIPNEYKKRKKKPLFPIARKDVPRIISSTGRSAFSTRIEIDNRAWNVGFTQHGQRLWVDANWNTAPPTLEGDVVQAAFICVLDEMRIRQFLSVEQITWLLKADPESGRLPAHDAEWVPSLHHDHDLIVPGDTPQEWRLGVFGREVLRMLQGRPIQPAPKSAPLR